MLFKRLNDGIPRLQCAFIFIPKESVLVRAGNMSRQNSTKNVI